jgi:hypothetical protein
MLESADMSTDDVESVQEYTEHVCKVYEGIMPRISLVALIAAHFDEQIIITGTTGIFSATAVWNVLVCYRRPVAVGKHVHGCPSPCTHEHNAKIFVGNCAGAYTAVDSFLTHHIYHCTALRRRWHGG